ncbi:MAG: YbjN domain-containing protein [Elainellaceae cyanobacterium]
MTNNTNLGTTAEAELTVDVGVASGLVDMIETIISSLEQDDSAMVRHLDGDGHLWTFKYGSVDVFVQLTGTSEEDTLKVWSTVLALPVQDEARLMHKLLQMNWSGTFEACFSILSSDQGDQVVVSAARTVAEISPGEISRNITIVATIADEQDDALAAEFSAA